MEPISKIDASTHCDDRYSWLIGSASLVRLGQLNDVIGYAQVEVLISSLSVILQRKTCSSYSVNVRQTWNC